MAALHFAIFVLRHQMRHACAGNYGTSTGQAIIETPPPASEMGLGLFDKLADFNVQHIL